MLNSIRQFQANGRTREHIVENVDQKAWLSALQSTQAVESFKLNKMDGRTGGTRTPNQTVMSGRL